MSAAADSSAAARGRRCARAPAARCSRSPRCSASRAVLLALAAAPAAPRARSSRARAPNTGRRRATTAASAKSRSGARQGRPAAARAELGHRAARRPRGVPVGQRSGERRSRPRAGPPGPAASWRRRTPSRSCSGPARSSTRRPNRSTSSSTARTDAGEGTGGAGAERSCSAALAAARRLERAQALVLGERASRITLARFQEELVDAGAAVRADRAPEHRRTEFVSTLVFDPAKPAGTPKQRFAYLFPSRDSALDLGADEGGALRSAAHAHDRPDPQSGGDAAVAAPARRRYLVSGEPVIVADLTKAITHSIEVLLVAVADRDGG